MRLNYVFFLLNYAHTADGSGWGWDEVTVYFGGWKWTKDMPTGDLVGRARNLWFNQFERGNMKYISDQNEFVTFESGVECREIEWERWMRSCSPRLFALAFRVIDCPVSFFWIFCDFQCHQSFDERRMAAVFTHRTCDGGLSEMFLCFLRPQNDVWLTKDDRSDQRAGWLLCF